MRKFVTIAATTLALALGAATPALANQHGNYPYQGGGYSNQHGNGPQGNYGAPQDGRYHDRDFDRHDGNFDRWERDWRYDNYDQYRHQRPLSYQQLSYRLAQQGYHGVRKVKKSRVGYRGYGHQYGFDYRAFAFNRRGEPVMLRINAYTGRVLDVRYLGRGRGRW
jgi:hypothetical protein